jgi:hypothetical protein
MTDPSPPIVRRIPAARLDEVESRLLRAEAAADFVGPLAREWGRSKRQIWTYVAIVRARLAARAHVAEVDPKADAEIVRGMALNAYRIAEIGHPERGPDPKGMVAATKLYAEITGAMAPRRVDLTSKGEQVGALPDDALLARIAELERAGG